MEAINKGDNKEGAFSEMLRDIALTGLATFFMTEESIRQSLKELKLPKDIMALMLEGISKKKDDFYGLLVKEFGQILSKVDLAKELSRFLEGHRIRLEFSFEKKEQP